jgi:hypothetical protein
MWFYYDSLLQGIIRTDVKLSARGRPLDLIEVGVRVADYLEVENDGRGA